MTLEMFSGIFGSITGFLLKKCVEGGETPARCAGSVLAAYLTVAGTVFAIYVAPGAISKLKSLFSRIKQQLGANATIEEVNIAPAEAEAKSE